MYCSNWEQMFSSDTLANDWSMVEMEGKGKDGKWTDRLAQELHKPRRVRFPRRRVHVKGIDLIWSSDFKAQTKGRRERKRKGKEEEEKERGKKRGEGK